MTYGAKPRARRLEQLQLPLRWSADPAPLLCSKHGCKLELADYVDVWKDLRGIVQVFEHQVLVCRECNQEMQYDD